MAYKIIKHRHPTEYAVHFICECGCEFYADQVELTKITDNDNFKKTHTRCYYFTDCPECGKTVISYEMSIPKDKVFDECMF